jgi:hypothetical protein
MTLYPTSLSLVAAAGVSSTPAALAVLNTRTVSITWAANPTANWLTASPATGSAVATAAGQVNVASAPLAAGVYSTAINVSSTSPDLEMTLVAPVTVTVVSTPTVAASVSFPAMAGTAITWTAAATAGSAALEYKFWRNDPAVGWHVVQDYSSSRSYSWTPLTSDVGAHFLQVWVRPVGSTAPYVTYVATDTFSITRPVASLTSLQSDMAFPQPTGSVIRWTAAASPSGVEYKFWLYRDGSGWSVLQDYSTSPQATWTPTSTGTYAVQVWARIAGTAVAYDDWRGTGYFRISNTDPLQLSQISSMPNAPYYAGTPIKWSVSATGGSAGPLQFRFWRFDQASNQWMIVQDYSAGSTYTWTPSDPGDLGTHAVQVWARSAGSTANFEAWQSTGYFSVARNPVTSVALTLNSGFPVPANTTITATAAATGGAQPAQYKFWVYRSGVGWSVLQDWSGAASATWTPTVDGTYALQVWSRGNGSTATYDAWAGTPMLTIGASGPATLTSLSANVALPAASGTTVTWTAVAQGGTSGPLQFKFWRLNQQTGVWSVVQDYGPANTFTWTPSDTEKGNYALQAWVRSNGSTAAYEGWVGTGSFTIR